MTTTQQRQVLGFTDCGDYALFDPAVLEDHLLGLGWHLMCDFEDPSNFTPAEAGDAAMSSMAPLMKALRERVAAGDADGLAAVVTWKHYVLDMIERSKQPA